MDQDDYRTLLVSHSQHLFQEELVRLYRDKEQLDAVLRCGAGKSIFCHKMVLAISPIVRLHLHEVDIDETFVVVLDGFDHEKVLEMVRNLYESLSVSSMKDFCCDYQLAETLKLNAIGQMLKSPDKTESKVIRTDHHDFSIKQEILDDVKMEMYDVENYLEYGDEENDDEDDLNEEDFAKKRVKRTRGKASGTAKGTRKPVKEKVTKKRKRAESENALLKCKYCSETFASARQMKYHRIKMHPLIGYVSCRVCRAKMENRKVADHILQCQKTFICDACGLTFQSWISHQKHIAAYHKAMTCGDCQLTFPCYSTYSKHRRVAHELPKPCDVCGKEYPSRRALYNHKKRIHRPDHEKRMRCQFCGKGFIDNNHLESHVASAHTRNNPFKCRYNCGKAFNDHGNRYKHERTHKIQAKEILKILPM